MALEQFRTKTVQPGELAVVVGAGRSGKAAARLLLQDGAKVRLLEKDPANIDAEFLREMTQAGAEVITGEHGPQHFADAAYVIPSPGMPVATLLPMLPASGGPEVMAEMELAWRHLHGEPVLAVTGTSGKTTTVSLAAAMLQAQGLSVFLGGNIGTPLSEYILSGRKADVLVVEISSFQLQTCSTFCPRVGVILNISPNHLDYHKDMEEYIDAKFRLLRCQSADDMAVLGEDVRELAEVRNVPSLKIWIDPAMNRFPESQLFGKHNRVNMEAAWLACRPFGVTEAAAAKAVAGFKPLPNRLERVDEKNGVLYVNDSKSTTIAALEVALAAFDRPVRLLCGGKFKGGDLSVLNDLVRAHVVAVALFGACREHFEQAWRGIVPMTWDATLEEAVRRVHTQAKAGYVVLMSPATASFDLYKNYVARGNDFKRVVGLL